MSEYQSAPRAAKRKAKKKVAKVKLRAHGFSFKNSAKYSTPRFLIQAKISKLRIWGQDGALTQVQMRCW